MKQLDSTKKLDDLYAKHDRAYNDFEGLIKKLHFDGRLFEYDKDKILELADEVVETNGAYTFAMGKRSLVRWLFPTWWYWVLIGRRKARRDVENNVS